MSNNDSPQDFEPDIPQFLLNDLSDKERWLYTSIGRSAKINEYLLEKVGEHSTDLTEIVRQTRATNGRVNKLSDYHEKNNKDIDQIIFWKRAFINKWTLVIIGGIAYICIQFPAIAGLLSLFRGV